MNNKHTLTQKLTQKYAHIQTPLSMEEQVEKTSPSLQRNAVYNRSTRIASLPRFLTMRA